MVEAVLWGGIAGLDGLGPRLVSGFGDVFGEKLVS